MQYRQLGNSSLLVSELALGTMLFGESNARGTSANEATRLVHEFLALGGNHIDTADVYAGGRSEELIGAALRGRRHEAVLATKVRFGAVAGSSQPGLSPAHVRLAVEASLQRLQTDYIDLYYMHGWDPLTPIDDALQVFDELVMAGKVRYIGVSNFKAWQVMKALGLSAAQQWACFVAAQYQYSLVQRDIEYEFVDLFDSEGVGLVPWGPLGGGFLAGKYQRDARPTAGRIATTDDVTEEAWHRRNTDRNWAIIDAVAQVAAARGVSSSQVALAWLRAQRHVTSVIIGARTHEQFVDNMAAAALDLSAAELASLSASSALPDLYPYRMMAAYGMTTAHDDPA